MNACATKAVIYCRVSSKKQTLEGHGLGSQETICREYAKRNGYAVINVYQDDMTGAIADRPGIKAMLKYLKKTKIRTSRSHHR